MEITLFTPTYNREWELKELYESLVNQTNYDFQWLIVDDGSTDGTCETVNAWIKEDRICIRYLYQKNQGKCAALKNGIRNCDTPWFFCVDSDDTLCCNAVQSMLEDIHAECAHSGIGFVYPQIMSRGDGRWIPDAIHTINIMDLKNLYGVTETAILFKTKYLKKIEIPLFEGEKFLSEEVLYIQLVEYGAFVPRKTGFYCSEYRDNGLTRNLFDHWVRNPKGTVLLMRQRFEYSRKYRVTYRIWERVKCIMNLNALCMVCRLRIHENTPSIIYSVALFIPSIIWKRIRFRR